MQNTLSFAAFLLTTAAFACLPGPAMLFAAAQALVGGRRSGLMAALGLHLGGYVHVFAAAAGLSVLFQAVPLLYTGTRLLGAAYLVWLGLGLIRGAGQAEAAPPAPRRSGRGAFLQSATVEILNPKTALFFLAFLPQFIAPAGSLPVWLQFVTLGTIVNLMFSATDVVCVLFASTVVATLRRSRRGQKLMRCAGGTLFIGLGAHVALQRG